ncbi:hypothetical protein HanIR_Chr10g0480331 [Helianthus annuus]|nr:hypothetical protein HanIR_Chr10g0480331 [Helianthus annuus]
MVKPRSNGVETIQQQVKCNGKQVSCDCKGEHLNIVSGFDHNQYKLYYLGSEDQSDFQCPWDLGGYWTTNRFQSKEEQYGDCILVSSFV